MIITIRSNNGFYRAVEFCEFEKDWKHYFHNLTGRVDFKICKNMNMYRCSNKGIFKNTFAPTIQVLKDNVEIY